MNFNPRTPCGVRRHMQDWRHDGCNFNPRTPCGVRPQRLIWRDLPETFQSTHPLRGATHIHNITFIADSGFQSTHPLRGATQPEGYTRQGRSYFNPRTPCGVRRYMEEVEDEQDAISIHAPLAGCDPGRSCRCSQERYFNPRTPCGVRHDELRAQDGGGNISIHAPLAGCDHLLSLFALVRICISIHAPLAGCDCKNTQKIFCIFAITDNKSRKDNVQRRLSERFPYKTGSVYLQK